MSTASGERLRDWVLAHAAAPVPAEALDARTPLLDSGLLTSFQVMELILFLEELTGRPVDVGRLQAGAFRDLDTIGRLFLGAGSEAER